MDGLAQSERRKVECDQYQVKNDQSGIRSETLARTIRESHLESSGKINDFAVMKPINRRFGVALLKKVDKWIS